MQHQADLGNHNRFLQWPKIALSVRSRIIAIAAIPVAGFLVNGTAFHVGETAVETALASDRAAVAMVEASGDLKSAVTSIQSAARSFVAQPRQEMAAQLDNGLKQAVAHFRRIEALDLSGRKQTEPVERILNRITFNVTELIKEVNTLGGDESGGIRKELAKLTAKEISGDQIVDPSVRAAVQKKYAELGGGLPSKLWGNRDDLNNFPRLPSKSGSGPGTIIRKVRLRTDAKPKSIGQDVRQRNIASGKDSNYASMVYAVLDAAGNEIRWEHEIITRLEAHERLSANHGQPGEKVLIPQESETRKFKFALRKNDMIEADGPDGTRVLYRIQSFSQSEVQLCEHACSIVTTKDRTLWNRITSLDNLRKRNARIVRMNAIGEPVPD